MKGEPALFVEAPARLQVIVDKTAGPRERDAMALLTDYVRRTPRPAQSTAR